MIPLTRADCSTVPRPCPHRTCRHHLDAETESCSLDVADRGEHLLTELAEILGYSSQNILQIEAKALSKFKRRLVIANRISQGNPQHSDTIK